ncbi:MAG: hypothetical protein K8T20_20590 [Planctomycetes bacterium]|nr:hypothetical protein [Planctomycetota bacterium]
MRRPLAAVLMAFASTASAQDAPAHPPEDDVASSLPEDIPGGRDGAAESLKSGVPQLVTNVLENLQFAQEEPVWAPWRVALEGKASREAGEIWVMYLFYILAREIDAKALREQGTAWFEAQTEMTPEVSAHLSAGLRWPSEILAKRHLGPARNANSNALLALAGNPAGHPLLLELCKSDVPEAKKINYIMGACHAQSIAFRSLFDQWVRSQTLQVYFQSVNGILRLGDPADVKVARDYLADPRSYRRFEVYRSLAWIKSKEAVDLMLAEQPRCLESNREAIVEALGREKDERILPRLRQVRDQEGYAAGVCQALWHHGRAGDVPWLLARMEADEPEAAVTLRKLLGKSCPIAFADRVAGVKKWIEEHKEAIEKDAELPLK